MKLILDLDTGIDDALAIAYAAGSPDAELIGITGTYGNVLMKDGLANALSVLDLLGLKNVPVYPGEPHALTKDDFEVLEISAFIHGADGIGEAEIDKSNRTPEETSAVDFLLEQTKLHDDLTIVATGPMTNLAAALRRDPSFAERANIVIMGGALTVPGNVNAWTEANINQDPEAADELLRSGANVTMVGLDVTLRTLLTTQHTAQWRELGTAGTFLAEMTDYYIRAYDTTAPHLGGCGLHDPLAVAVALDPSLVTTLDLALKVDTEGPTRGRTIGDEMRLSDSAPTTRAAIGVDVERFVEMFMSRVMTAAKNA
ncbi:nucleoside hydrolase [Corynebacterium sp. TAE3-ERU12]|uniref:nucleoside hydrolase n=1 Tax=Corynebacterium sp. TAE3-ERU12 TaxID=2849491 RepID=UPI001C48214B|nr:nucleoside hydrolase [Corynebacterium sp. TAE3-ERU12]MBV7295552.1 nucleoside hydrolase [Corynebacterium sp. TAE3-ERU12]